MDGLHIPTVAHTGTFAYSASKAAVHHQTRSLAIELAPRQITVNAVAPGFFPSQMTDYVMDHYGKDIKANADDVKTISDGFNTRNEIKLIDPLNAKDLSAKLSNEVEDFLANVDVALSISNATQFIEI